MCGDCFVCIYLVCQCDGLELGRRNRRITVRESRLGLTHTRKTSCGRSRKELWASSCVDEVFAHFAVVGGCVMLGEVIRKVMVCWGPVHVVLLLVDAIPDSIETHVDGTGSSLSDGVVGEANSSGVIN